MTFEEILAWPIPVLITDVNRKVLYFNQNWLELYGATADEVINQQPSMMQSGFTARTIYQELNTSLKNSGAWSGVLINRHLTEKRFLVVALTIMRWVVEDQTVFVSLHQPLDRLCVDSAVSIGSLQTMEGIFLLSIAKIAEWNDPELENHVLRVSKFARWISEMMRDNGDIPDADVDLIEAASVVHDIGKAAVPKEILFKPGLLTDSERYHVKDHASIGSEMINTIYHQMQSFHNLYGKLFEYAMDSALTHHEWWNGNGYPNGLKESQIPIVGRVVALADVIDALLSDRPYKKKWPPSQVLTYIKNYSGLQFDPKIVDVVITNWDHRPIFVD